MSKIKPTRIRKYFLIYSKDGKDIYCEKGIKPKYVARSWLQAKKLHRKLGVGSHVDVKTTRRDNRGYIEQSFDVGVIS